MFPIQYFWYKLEKHTFFYFLSKSKNESIVLENECRVIMMGHKSLKEEELLSRYYL